jgi:protein-S-isoprenylcysteine O-methyltransferase Ste14
MSTSGISDRTGPDSTKVGAWLFRHRTSIPIPFATALLLIPAQPSAARAPIVAGVTLTLLGELVRVWGVRQIGVISRTRSDRLGPLVESGPFQLCRNPLYLGNMAIWVGFTLTARLLWLAPIVFALLFAEYHAIVRWEEALLESRIGQPYRDYASRVPRWLPAFHNWALGGSGAREVRHSLSAVGFSLGEALFSERGTLIAIAAGFLLLWLKARS